MQVLEKLDFNNSTIQHVVLASIPPQQPPVSTPEVHCSTSMPCVYIGLMSCAFLSSCLQQHHGPSDKGIAAQLAAVGLVGNSAQVIYQADNKQGEWQSLVFGPKRLNNV